MVEYEKAMLFGFMLGDGWISKRMVGNTIAYNGGFSGDAESLQTAKDDLKTIYGNIGKASILKRKTSSPKYGITGTTTSFCVNKAVINNFIEIGMPIGKRVETEFILPEWIINGDINTKKAFLSGLYAAEGFEPAMQKNDKTLKPLGFALTKRRILESNLNKLFEQLASILDDLNIEYSIYTKYTFTCDTSVYKRFDFKNNIENIIRVLNILDVKYCRRKNDAIKNVLEYYGSKIKTLEMLSRANDESKDRTKTAKFISNKYGITRRQVEKWREREGNASIGIRIPNTFPTYTKFLCEKNK